MCEKTKRKAIKGRKIQKKAQNKIELPNKTDNNDEKTRQTKQI